MMACIFNMVELGSMNLLINKKDYVINCNKQSKINMKNLIEIIDTYEGLFGSIYNQWLKKLFLGVCNSLNNGH